jgi:hypothetical protein
MVDGVNLTPRPRGSEDRSRVQVGALHDLVDGVARVLGAHPTHLVRAFGREFGIPPHRYLTGRRLDAARRRLLLGSGPPRWRLLGVTPAAYARSAQ